MSLLTKVVKPLVRLLPSVPCWWNGQRLQLPPELWGAFRETYETDLCASIRKDLVNSAYFVDIGANHGMFTVWACRIAPTIRVLAVEPSRASRALEKVIRLNRLSASVSILKCCISSETGTSRFFDNGSMTSGLSEQWAVAHSANCEAYDVEVVSLSQLMKQVSQQCRPADHIVVKCDIEGHEEVAFLDASPLFDNRITYYVECHNCQDIKSTNVFRAATAAGRQLRIVGACWGSHLTVRF